MKTKLIILFSVLFIIIFLISYLFSSTDLDVTIFNSSIENNNNIGSVQELAELYYFKWSDEKKEISINIKELKDWITEVIILNDWMRDDSVSAEKKTLRIKNNNWIWEVLDIKWSWKCKRGRGQFFWWWTFCS